MADFKFKSMSLMYEVKCDNCRRIIFPRTDPVFKDFSYGVIFCLKCWTTYTDEKLKDNHKRS